MTPMIDVTFLLLIFFIVTLKFRSLEGRLDASLPKRHGTGNESVEKSDKLQLLVFLEREGHQIGAGPDAHWEGRQLRYEIGTHVFRELAGVGAFLAEIADKATPVVLASRGPVVYGEIVQLLDAVITAGFAGISFEGARAEDG